MRCRVIRILCVTFALSALLPTDLNAVASEPDQVPSASTDDARTQYLVQTDGLTPTDAAFRVGVQDAAMPRLAPLQDSLGPGFGGTWFSSSTGRLTIGITPSVSQLDQHGAREVLGPDVAAVSDFTSVVYSYDTLAQITADLSEPIASLNEHASVSVTLETVPSDNVVQILYGTGDLTPAQTQFMTDALSKYGSAVTLVRVPGDNTAVYDSCSGANCDPPLRGGMLIRGSGGTGCTLGFIGRKNSSIGPLVALTSGHCLRDDWNAGGGDWSAYFSNGGTHLVGPGALVALAGTTYPYSGNQDAGYIDISNPTGWSPRAETDVQASGTTTADPTYAISGQGSSVMNMIVCKVGAFYGSSCGTVFGLGATGPSGVTGMGHASYYCGNGDSGGSVVANHIAYGLHESHKPASPPPDEAGGNPPSHDCYYVGINGSLAALNAELATGD